VTKTTTIVRRTLAEIKQSIARGEDQTREDAPEAEPMGDDFWKNAILVEPHDRKTSVHLRLDPEIMHWFKAQGKGHLTKMNLVLRAYVQAQKARKAKKNVHVD